MGRLINIARDVIRKSSIGAEKGNVFNTTLIEYLYVTDKCGSYIRLDEFLKEIEERMGG